MFYLKSVIPNISSFSIYESELAYVDMQNRLFLNSIEVLKNVYSALLIDNCIAVNFSNYTFEIFDKNNWFSLLKNEDFGFINTVLVKEKIYHF